VSEDEVIPTLLTNGVTNEILDLNPECGYEYFRPFSCKIWYLCPSCNQKRLQLFAEHLSENLLLKLPHRQFIFTLPKLLQVYFKQDRNPFEEVSKIIFCIVHDYRRETTPATILTGIVVSYQSFGNE
jgi:hypothetical protein